MLGLFKRIFSRKRQQAIGAPPKQDGSAEAGAGKKKKGRGSLSPGKDAKNAARGSDGTNGHAAAAHQQAAAAQNNPAGAPGGLSPEPFDEVPEYVTEAGARSATASPGQSAAGGETPIKAARYNGARHQSGLDSAASATRPDAGGSGQQSGSSTQRYGTAAHLPHTSEISSTVPPQPRARARHRARGARDSRAAGGGGVVSFSLPPPSY